MDIDIGQTCKLCGKTFTVRDILKAATSYWSVMDVVISSSPCCNRREELRLENGKIWRGYAYAAGGPHFAGMECYELPTLKILRKDSMLSFDLDGKARTLSPWT